MKKHKGHFKPAKDPKLSSAKKVFKSYDDGDLAFDQFLVLVVKNCFYCDAPPSNQYSAFASNKGSTKSSIKNGTFIYSGLDRVNNDLPHSTDNCVPCCWTCNQRKKAMTEQEFYDWISAVHKNLKKKKKL